MRSSRGAAIAVALGGAVGACCLVTALFGAWALGTAARDDVVADEPFAAARARHTTRLWSPGPSEQPYDDAVPDGATRVHYESDGRSLLAWLAVPPGATAAPLVVYAHGGFALGVQDFEDARPFYERGAVLLLPAFRGENGNAGTFELAYGELDDLAAAVRYGAALEAVDPARIHLIGHSSGGMLTALAALDPTLPVALTASIGGAYSEATLAAFGDFAPFDVLDPRERLLRSMLPFSAQLAHRHVAYLGFDDLAIRSDLGALGAAAARAGGRLELVDVPGDHMGSIEPAVRDFLARTIPEEERGTP